MELRPAREHGGTSEKTYFPLVGGQVTQDVRPHSFIAQTPVAEAAPHLAVFIRQYVVPVPADQRAAHQVGELQVGENMLEDPSWQPPGHPCASSGCSSVGRAGGAATGCRCCAQTGGASSSTGRSRHCSPALHRRDQPGQQLHLTPENGS